VSIAEAHCVASFLLAYQPHHKFLPPGPSFPQDSASRDMNRAVGVVASVVRRMNEVNLRRARLVLGWEIVFGRVQRSVCNQPTRLT